MLEQRESVFVCMCVYSLWRASRANARRQRLLSRVQRCLPQNPGVVPLLIVPTNILKSEDVDYFR